MLLVSVLFHQNVKWPPRPEAPCHRTVWFNGYATDSANVTFPEMSKKSVALPWPPFASAPTPPPSCDYEESLSSSLGGSMNIVCVCV